MAVHTLYAFLDDAARAKVTVKEFTVNQSVRHIVSELFALKPTALAFSCYIWNIDLVKAIVRDCKKIMPHVPVLVGGPEVSFEYDHLYDYGVDCVVPGEGERAFALAVRMLAAGETLPRVLQAEPVPLADIPPYFCHGHGPGLGDPAFDHKILYYEASRGCPNRCQFCLSSSPGSSRLRFLPLDRVESDLRAFLNAKVKQVKFVDRTFNGHARHAEAIWRFLLAHDNGVTNFHFEIAADRLTDAQCALLAQARPGLFQFEIGVQSTHGPTLEAIQRSTDIPRLLANVRILQAPGNIHLHLDLIAGLPKETYDAFAQSFDAVMACRPDRLQVGFLKLLKGCGLRADAQRFGLVYRDDPPYDILASDAMDFAQLDRLHDLEHMVDTFYNGPGFRRFTEYQITKFGSPFAFFESLAAYWKANGLHCVSHKRTALYQHCHAFDPSRRTAEILKYDMLTHENVRTFPPFIEEYYRYDHKLISRNTAVHTFDYDVAGAFEEKSVRVVFRYGKQGDYV